MQPANDLRNRPSRLAYRARFFLVAALAAGVASMAQAAPFSSLFVFGDSLSDAGNNAIVINERTTVPISGDTFVPSFPYASTRYTNGLVWAQSFASWLGTSATPSLLGGSDYAYGGARTGPSGSGFPHSLRDQVGQFLDAVHGSAPADSLFVLAGGGNNARDALSAVAGGTDATTAILQTASEFVADTVTMVQQLIAAGAGDIVVWTAPNLAFAPAITALGSPEASAFATALADTMNTSLTTALAPFAGVVQIFDLNRLLGDLIEHPLRYGLLDVTNACAAELACDPAKYLFWDGIHPTSAGHALIARAMIALVPVPGSLALLLAGFGPVLLLSARGRVFGGSERSR